VSCQIRKLFATVKPLGGAPPRDRREQSPLTPEEIEVDRHLAEREFRGDLIARIFRFAFHCHGCKRPQTVSPWAAEFPKLSCGNAKCLA
jgi:hypothetical protein